VPRTLDDTATRLGPSGLKALLAKHHLQLCAFSVYIGGYPKYGAELLGGVGGGVAIQGSAAPCKPEELTAQMRRIPRKPEAAARTGREETTPASLSKTTATPLLNAPDSFKAFVDLNTSPRVGLALAPYHLQQAARRSRKSFASAASSCCSFTPGRTSPRRANCRGIGPTGFSSPGFGRWRRWNTAVM